MPLIISKSRKIGLKKCSEFAQNSQKWCTKFASYARRIFIFFGAEYLQALWLYAVCYSDESLPVSESMQYCAGNRSEVGTSKL